jgi:voltage-gated potassium channel Kch
VVDVNEASLERAASDGYLTVRGDATTDAVLLAAGVKRARTLVTAAGARSPTRRPPWCCSRAISSS